MTIKQDKVTTAIYSHPFIITALLVFVVLISTGMQINNNGVCCAVMALGFVLRLGYVLYTGLYIRQSRYFGHILRVR